MQRQVKKIEEFLAKEVKKAGFNSVVLGLSGGIDSAVVGLFCAKIFGANARAFIMPSLASNPQNTQDAVRFAQSIGLYYEVIDIGDFQQVFTRILDMSDNATLRIGNFCARMRMSLLYDKSQLYKSLVIGTSNKSELMLGYGTIYGDLACGINPLGDIFKSEIFEIAKFLKIPPYIIDKKPSADLFAGQSDEGDLGHTYAELDKILRHIEKGAKEKDLIALGFPKAFAKSTLRRVKQNAFKRQLPKIAKMPKVAKPPKAPKAPKSPKAQKVAKAPKIAKTTK